MTPFGPIRKKLWLPSVSIVHTARPPPSSDCDTNTRDVPASTSLPLASCEVGGRKYAPWVLPVAAIQRTSAVSPVPAAVLGMGGDQVGAAGERFESCRPLQASVVAARIRVPAVRRAVRMRGSLTLYFTSYNYPFHPGGEACSGVA